MRVAVVIQRLEAEKASFAKEALERPGSDGFDYGRAVGFYAGIEHAKQLLITMQSEDEERGLML